MTDALKVRCLRLLVVSIMVAWLCKAAFWSVALPQAAAWPLHDFFFPPYLQRVNVVLLAALAPLALSAWAVLRGDLELLVTSLVVLAAASLLLLLHQLTFNDATFVTSFWTALFGLWLHRASRSPGARVVQRAGVFAQLIVGLLFLGGFVGKLTPGYWDGSVMYGLYFQHSPHWTFELARGQLSPDGLRAAARWYSRNTLLCELMLASLPLWPARVSMWFAVFALSALTCLNNFKLLSVTAPLLGMCLTALALERWAEREVDVETPEVAPSGQVA